VDLTGVGRILLVAALVLAVFGVAFLLAGRGVIPRIPGDLSFGSRNFRIYIPIGTSIVLSVLLTVILNLFLRR
jgi:hypothetical protein